MGNSTAESARGDDDRWHLTLEQIGQISAQYQALVRMTQHGLGAVSGEVAEARRDLITLQHENISTRATIQECLTRLARLETDSAMRTVLIRYSIALNTVVVLVLLASFAWQLIGA